jgi:hypothetical protein
MTTNLAVTVASIDVGFCNEQTKKQKASIEIMPIEKQGRIIIPASSSLDTDFL